MPIAIDALLAELSADAPCGPDLEYDPEFTALEQAARGKPEQQFGSTVVPAEEPDWNDVRQRAQALFARTKDLRVGVFLTRALTRQNDMVGLNAGLTLIRGLLERYWDQVHPRLDPEEGNDATMRLNALAPIADPDALLREVKLMHLIRSGPHKVMVRDILVTQGKLPSSGGGIPTPAQIEGAIQAAAKDSMASIDAARSALQTGSGLYSLLISKVGSDKAPDLRPLTDVLKAVVQVCDKALPASVAGEAGGGVDAGPAEAPVARDSGEIRTREDALRLLDRVCEFMERTEPSNPAPLLVRRAQRLISKSFVEIIQELAPDSLKTIQQIAGLEKK